MNLFDEHWTFGLFSEDKQHLPKTFFPSIYSKDFFFDWLIIIILLFTIFGNIYSLVNQKLFDETVEFYELLINNNK